jgi:hypothetical protein
LHGFYCKNGYEILRIHTVLFAFHCGGINLNETFIEEHWTYYVSFPSLSLPPLSLPSPPLYFQIALSV